jgi:hypothetical protein
MRLTIKQKQQKLRIYKFRKLAQRRKKLFMCLLNFTKRTVDRTIWVMPRETDIYRDIINWTPQDWYRNVRMSQQTFNHICDQLAPLVQKRTTKFRTPVPVCKRVMLTLWRLATNIEYRTLGHLFGVCRGTVCVIFHEIIDAINAILQHSYLKFPSGQSLRNVVDGYRTRWNFPQCCGAIDGTHIPIIAPKEHHTCVRSIYFDPFRSI